LIRALSIELRVLMLLEFVVRRRLAADLMGQAGLHTDSPKQARSHPTAEHVLDSLEELTLTIT
jgi:hypothetical protein